jgi:hypothetical protein
LLIGWSKNSYNCLIAFSEGDNSFISAPWYELKSLLGLLLNHQRLMINHIKVKYEYVVPHQHVCRRDRHENSLRSFICSFICA